MIAVIFEVLPHPHTKQTYLELAASLRPRLDRIDGFISIERFQSLTDPHKILSLSFFRDEEAVAQGPRTRGEAGSPVALDPL
ncbi:MAG TPA: antibiotic biosynthesis monooxygenase [Steroidobacteraceae bacterium]|nr:antibiotic biosynthesis monooxygenase [Steroidobacteraceae bacterium]